MISLGVEVNFFFFLILNLSAEQHSFFMLEALESLEEILTTSTPQHSDLFPVSMQGLEHVTRVFQKYLFYNTVQLG